ncbi:MAG: cysteine desulfurase [Firmicutes bacterium]|nr:cysteine desulfurase [Bacillota bacterium]
MDVDKIRPDFPILGETIDGHRLVYLDNAATSQKPRIVLEALRRFYEHDNANVYRSVHTLAARATQAYEDARARAARFIGAARPEEIVFTRGTTEALNLVAAAYGRSVLRPGDEIATTVAEHHSNLVPWQQTAKATGARLVFLPLRADGQIDLDAARRLIGPRTRIVAVAHVSNVLGTVAPVAELAQLAHAQGAVLVVDGAQSVPHMPVDVRALGADFLAFSGHKMCGPTGIGVLYGRYELLEKMPPVLFGGEMIEVVELEDSTFKDPPYRFEGGTPNIAGAVGLAAAMDYLDGIGREAIHRHETALTAYALERLAQVPDLELYGPRQVPYGGSGGSESVDSPAPGGRPGANALKTGVLAFNLRGIHPHDLATVLDAEGVAVRAGHHCAQPLMRWLGVQSTARASLYLYNTPEDVDALAAALAKAKEYFRRVSG